MCLATSRTCAYVSVVAARCCVSSCSRRVCNRKTCRCKKKIQRPATASAPPCPKKKSVMAGLICASPSAVPSKKCCGWARTLPVPIRAGASSRLREIPSASIARRTGPRPRSAKKEPLRAGLAARRKRTAYCAAAPPSASPAKMLDAREGLEKSCSSAAPCPPRSPPDRSARSAVDCGVATHAISPRGRAGRSPPQPARKWRARAPPDDVARACPGLENPPGFAAVRSQRWPETGTGSTRKGRGASFKIPPRPCALPPYLGLRSSRDH